MIRSFIATALALATGPVLAADFLVTNTNPDGPGSFVEAVARANASAGPDRIRFNIPGPGPHVIRPSSVMFALDTVDIDGYSQPGSVPNSADYGSNAGLRIALSGEDITGVWFTALLNLRGFGSSVRGIAFIHAPHNTLLRLEGGEHTVYGNFFGLHPDGTTAGSGEYAIQVAGEANAIGSPMPADRNVFASTHTGIRIGGPAAIRNSIRNNVFGTTADGLQSRPFRDFAVLVTYGSSYNRVGDFAPGAGNLFLGGATGTGIGVRIGGNDTSDGSPESVSNPVLGNTMLGYRERAIELRREPAPCLPYDMFDADTGPNRCMNLPVIESATLEHGVLRVQGRVATEPTTRPQFPLLVHVYLYGSSAACSATSADAEFMLAANYEIAVDSIGQSGFSFELPLGNLQVRSVTAQLGIEDAFVDSTSELAPCTQVVSRPPAPTLAGAASGDHQATLQFTAPSYDGGTPILDYRAECLPGPVVAVGAGSPLVVGGLQNDVEYSCTVRARNAAGLGEASQARSVTPRALRAPTLEVPGQAQARVWEYLDVALVVDGYPEPALALQGTLPAGLEFSPTERRISGWPDRGSVGSYTLHITASNSSGPAVTRTMTLHVARGEAILEVEDIPDRELGGDHFLVGITGSSNATPELLELTATVCSVARVTGNQPARVAGAGKADAGKRGTGFAALVTMRATGRCEFRASQPANADFEASEAVTAGFTIRTPGSGALLFSDGFEARAAAR